MWVKWPGKSKNFYPKIQWFVSAVFGVIDAETKDKDSTKDIPKDRDVPYQRMYQTHVHRRNLNQKCVNQRMTHTGRNRTFGGNNP